jgi:hypothetical protein
LTSSGSDYSLRIPKHVVQQIDALIPFGLSEDVLEQLRHLETHPEGGALGPDGSTRFYVFKVERPPLVLSVVVTYAVLDEQRFVLLQRVAMDEGEDADEE